MFLVLYRWRLKPEKEKQFVEAWSEVTGFIRTEYDSLGSRLHRGSDGLFYGYAQWKSAEQRKRAFASMPALEGRRKMQEAIEESLPEIILENVSDYLILPEEK
jgi:heme-degrading monooxygenase HmoA